MLGMTMVVAGYPEGWPTPHVTSDDCHTMQGSDNSDYVAWCLTSHASVDDQAKKQGEMEGMLRGCEWAEYPEGELAEHSFTMDVGANKDLTLMPTPPDYSPLKGAKQKYCQAGDWWINAVGPETTYGNYTWVRSSLQLQGYTLGAENDGPEGVGYVTGFYFGVVEAASMSMVSYPPIHIHHAHTHSNYTFDFSHEVYHHGDSQCLDGQGGAACMIYLLPENNAFRMTRPMLHNAETNDVRPEGSPGMTLYYIAALRIAPAATGATTRRVTNFGDGYGMGNTINTLFRGYPDTYVIPGNKRSATWDELFVYTPFNIRWGYFHTHPQWVEGIYIYINVTSGELGLPALLPEREVLYTVGEVDDTTNTTHDDAINGMLDHLESTPQYVPTCIFKREMSPHDTYTDTEEAGNDFYRLNTACRPFNATAGMSVTVVVVMAPSGDDVMRDRASVHTGARLFIETDAYTEKSFSPSVGSQLGLPAKDGSGLVSWTKDKVSEDPWSGLNDPVYKHFIPHAAAKAKEALEAKEALQTEEGAARASKTRKWFGSRNQFRARSRKATSLLPEDAVKL